MIAIGHTQYHPMFFFIRWLCIQSNILFRYGFWLLRIACTDWWWWWWGDSEAGRISFRLFHFGTLGSQLAKFLNQIRNADTDNYTDSVPEILVLNEITCFQRNAHMRSYSINHIFYLSCNGLKFTIIAGEMWVFKCLFYHVRFEAHPYLKIFWTFKILA